MIGVCKINSIMRVALSVDILKKSRRCPSKLGFTVFGCNIVLANFFVFISASVVVLSLGNLLLFGLYE